LVIERLWNKPKTKHQQEHRNRWNGPKIIMWTQLQVSGSSHPQSLTYTLSTHLFFFTRSTRLIRNFNPQANPEGRINLLIERFGSVHGQEAGYLENTKKWSQHFTALSHNYSKKRLRWFTILREKQCKFISWFKFCCQMGFSKILWEYK
jgi:hypothetical protein